MSHKTASIVLAVLAIAALGYVWQSETRVPAAPAPQAPTETNAEALTGEVAGVKAEHVAYFEGANGYYARPESEGNYPGVVMIHENKGLNDGVRKMARQLAQEGYAVLAVDLFGKSVETQEEARGLTAGYDQAKGIENLRAAAAYLRFRGAYKLASLGWCFGGGQSMQLALSGEELDATVIYYGRLVSDEAALEKIVWPVLGVFGDKDTSISATSVAAFDTALDNVGIENEIYMYPGVGHAFANPSGANYAPEETADAWAKTVEFLRKHLK